MIVKCSGIGAASKSILRANPYVILQQLKIQNAIWMRASWAGKGNSSQVILAYMLRPLQRAP